MNSDETSSSALPPIPLPPVPGPPTGQARATRPIWTSMATKWARVPLRTQLVTLITTLLLVGFGIAGGATTIMIPRYLVSQVDHQLSVAATNLMERGSINALITTSGQSLIPSEYYLGIVMSSGQRENWSYTATTTANGVPSLNDAPLPTHGITKPFTTAAETPDGVPLDSPGSWRAVGIPVTNVSTGETGTAYVALPLTGVMETVSKIERLLVVSSLSLAIMGGIIGSIAVRRSLRPLRRIETTAAAIAAGDLSARIPESPANTEVGSLALSLNTMLTQIESGFTAREASEARMRRFVADASHELRTPLAAIRGYGELYRMGALTSEEAVDDTMSRIEVSAQRMGTLVEDLLDLARLDEGRALKRSTVDLHALATDAAADLHALDPSRAVSVVGLKSNPSEEPSATLIPGDEDRIRQVLMNLVGNTARHTPAGSPVEIAVGSAADGAGVLEVRDHGPGINPDQAIRIFERFYRADSSRDRRSGGSGLGLAIVSAIINSHGGNATVSETDGGGLTIRVELPGDVLGRAESAAPSQGSA